MLDIELFRGGINSCFQHVVHHLIARIPEIAKSEEFNEYLKTVKEVNNRNLMKNQEDAGMYLLQILDKEKWLYKKWKRECSNRFMNVRLNKKDNKLTIKRSMDPEHIIVIYPQPGKTLTENVIESLTVDTDELKIVKRIQHPSSRFLVVNLTSKVQEPTPPNYFETIEFSKSLRYKIVGCVIHIGCVSGSHGHYIYLSRSGNIYNDMRDDVQTFPAGVMFSNTVCPSLLLYERVTRRRIMRSIGRSKSVQGISRHPGRRRGMGTEPLHISSECLSDDSVPGTPVQT